MDNSDRIFLEKLCREEPEGVRNHWEEVLARVISRKKAELHCHLAGSMRPETLRDLARSSPGLDWSFCNHRFGGPVSDAIATGTVEDAKMHIEYRKQAGSLADYMNVYSLPKTVMETPEAIRRVIFEVCEDNHREGVRYLEIRFNPVMMTGGMGTKDYIMTLCEGLDEAAERYPSLEVALLLSMIKDFSGELVERVVDEVVEVNEDSAVRGRVKGIDSSGNEAGFKAENHEKAFARARAASWGITCHAGEAFHSLEDGISAIERAIDLLGARRIGHGLAAGIDPFTLLGASDARGISYDAKRAEKIAESQLRLRKRLKEENILVEVCPSSNLHTGNVRSLSEHPVKAFLAEKVPVAICTDNRWISHTKLSWEIVRVAKIFNLGAGALNSIIDAPFRYKLENLVNLKPV